MIELQLASINVCIIVVMSVDIKFCHNVSRSYVEIAQHLKGTIQRPRAIDST